jgi:hypothetical protein
MKMLNLKFQTRLYGGTNFDPWYLKFKIATKFGSTKLSSDLIF